MKLVHSHKMSGKRQEWSYEYMYKAYPPHFIHKKKGRASHETALFSLRPARHFGKA